MRGSDCRLLLATIIILVLLYHTWTGHSLLRGNPSDSLSAATADVQMGAWRSKGRQGSRAHRGIKIKVRKRQSLSDPVPTVHIKAGRLRAADEAAEQASSSNPAATLITVNQQSGSGAATQELPASQHIRIPGGQGSSLDASDPRVHAGILEHMQRTPGGLLNIRIQDSVRARAAIAEQTMQQRPAGLQAGGAVGMWGIAAVQQALLQHMPPQGLLSSFQTVRPWEDGAAPLPLPGQTCEAWLASADRVPGARNFTRQPITVLADADETLAGCSVPCRMTAGPTELTLPMESGAVPAYDAHFGQLRSSGHLGLAVMRSMESVTNYADLDTARAHSAGVQVVMTPHLDSDVPAGYLSWAEYDIMRPPEAKQEQVAAFISNCRAASFRLAALEQLSGLLDVHSYGRCSRTSDTHESKVVVLRKYHFSLAFENSQEEDYVTEKFAQALEAGSVPIVIGPPNIGEFEPAPGSVLVLNSIEDVPKLAARAQYLLQNRTAYEEMLAWKRAGPQDSFLALVDLNNVHSTCRLCIHLATGVRAREAAALERGAPDQRRPCRCTRRESGEVVHHLRVRERGRLAALDVFLEGRQLTVGALHAAITAAFRGAGHRPLFLQHRPDFRLGERSSAAAADASGAAELRPYRVYPVGATQKAALHGDAALDTDAKVAAAVLQAACLHLEVIFV